MALYDFKKIEKRWRKKWKEEGIYEPDPSNPSSPFYNLMMFPYPSAEGLHVGNMYAFTGSDIYGRFKTLESSDKQKNSCLSISRDFNCWSLK